MKKDIFKFLKKAQTYCVDTSGAIALLFGLMVPVLVGVAGLALDLSSAYLVQARLSQALDASALAAAASSDDPEIIEQKVQEFFDLNYSAEKLGVTFTPEVSIYGDEITVTGTARYDTSFLSVIGVHDISVAASVVVQRQVQGLEVVLVMDNTGSMNTNNNIAALREAASSFVDIIFDATTNPEYVKIGLVPYSSSVNVGPYGLGLDMDGANYGAPFVDNPNNYSYDTSDASEWHGCVLAADYPDDTIDHEGPWDIYRYCRNVLDVPTCDTRRGNPRRPANHFCPATPVVPLSSDQTTLLDSIDTMRANGFTYGNFGMVWGYRLLSPNFPFEEATPYANNMWQKVIIMMTDGNNFTHRHYSAYGRSADANISADDLDDRFAEVCENAKAQGVIIYTITFTSGIGDDTKDFYRNCATSQSQYYDAPEQEDLIQVFERIGRELSALHIKS